MNSDKSGTNIFLKIFSKFLGAKKEGGVGGILERGGGVYGDGDLVP
jgi:hypothetical protein